MDTSLKDYARIPGALKMAKECTLRAGIVHSLPIEWPRLPQALLAPNAGTRNRGG